MKNNNNPLHQPQNIYIDRVLFKLQRSNLHRHQHKKKTSINLSSCLQQPHHRYQHLICNFQRVFCLLHWSFKIF
ncbi:hypothetical protein NC652_022490 [Populus alba x Populus x berolinensis]|nr:hypothetical protein NC652_022486 [Populus alba x Populus x berolinensis]KAJ6904489.1 hypothetical protein NC652_022490 [Populus alba x Populus x berolinensis]